MYLKTYIKYFLKGFIAAFKLNGDNLRVTSQQEWTDYFTTLEQDLSLAFNKLKNRYERD